MHDHHITSDSPLKEMFLAILESEQDPEDGKAKQEAARLFNAWQGQGLHAAAAHLCALLEDKSLPRRVREDIGKAVNEIANRHNRGDEFDVAWFKMFFADAVITKERDEANESQE